jgi:hypothetical protein
MNGGETNDDLTQEQNARIETLKKMAAECRARTSFQVVPKRLFVGRAFPTDYMLGYQDKKRGWTIDEIIAHTEFLFRVDMIIEQFRTVGCYFGEELELLGVFFVPCM